MKKFLSNIVLIALSILIALLMAEGALRLLHVPIPLTLSDRDLGIIYRPHTVQSGGNSESGHVLTVSINSEGFRDDEWKAGASSTTVLVVGDSMVTAFEVTKDERFTDLLEQKLSASSTAPWQVLNAGIAGTGPDVYLERIKKFEPIFDPAYTVVVIYNGNDPQNINYDITPAGGRKNYIVRDGNVISYNDIAGIGERFKWELKLLMSHSYLVELINDRYIKAKYIASRATETTAVLPEYCNLSQKDFENSFLIMKKLLKDIDTASNHKLILVSIPDKQQLRTDLPANCDPYLVEPILSKEAQALHVPFIALYDYFKPIKEELYFAGHLNPLGHTVLSNILFQEIEKLQSSSTQP